MGFGEEEPPVADIVLLVEKDVVREGISVRSL